MLAMIKGEIDCGRPNREFLLELCKAAAPYVHAKMHENKVSGALEIIHVPHVKEPLTASPISRSRRLSFCSGSSDGTPALLAVLDRARRSF